MSSELRLKVLMEFETKASITLSSTPACASLMTDSVGPEGLILDGKVFSSETTTAGFWSSDEVASATENPRRARAKTAQPDC